MVADVYFKNFHFHWPPSDSIGPSAPIAPMTPMHGSRWRPSHGPRCLARRAVTTYELFRLERQGLRVDLLINNTRVIELKSVETLIPVHHKPMLTDLRLAHQPKAPDRLIKIGANPPTDFTLKFFAPSREPVLCRCRSRPPPSSLAATLYLFFHPLGSPARVAAWPILDFAIPLEILRVLCAFA